MSTSIAEPEGQGERILALKRRCPYFTVFDIVAVTGIPIADVRVALGRYPDKQPCADAVDATGPVYAMTSVAD